MSAASARHTAAMALPMPTKGAARGDRRRVRERLVEVRARGRVRVPVLTRPTLTLN
jgi:hypothetical protein